MNKKKKNQIVFLCILLFIVLAAFIALKIYQANVPEDAQTDAESYMALEIDKSQVDEIGIINDTGTINLLKDGEDWKCMDESGILIDSSVVDSFLDNVSSISSTDKIENVDDLSQYGLEDPGLNVTLQWKDNMYTIKVGDYNSIVSSYYININDENTVYTINSSCYYNLNKTLEDFEQIDISEEEEDAVQE